MDEKIYLAIPAVGEYRKWAEVTAASARGTIGQGSAGYRLETVFLDWTNCDRARLEQLGVWHGSAITYAKLFLDEILPHVDKVIVADADILFRGDISNLWDFTSETEGDSEKTWLWASRDSQPPWLKVNSSDSEWFADKGLELKHPERYFCAGLMVMNLKAMREGGWAKIRDEFLSCYDMRTIPFGEQAVLNYLLQEHTKLLPRQWGCFSGDTNDDVDYNGDCAIHYVGDLPWERKGVTRLMSDAVVCWRRAAGMSTGGWRRWLWCALRATSWLWRWEPHLAWHFRTALRKRPSEVNGMLVVDRLLRDCGMIGSDEVWVHGMWLPRYWRKCVWAKIRGKRLVRMTHGSLDPVRLDFHGLKKRLVKPIEKLLFKMADKIVFTGEWEAQWFKAWMKGQERKFEVVDLKRFFDLAGANVDPGVRGTRGNGTDGDPLRVLYLGRRHPLKGVKYLEAAVDAINDNCGAKAKIELRVISNHFGAELARDWQWCEVLCLPTLSENFGLVVAEALELGKRVITTDGAPAWADFPGVVYLRGFSAGDDKRRVGLLDAALRHEIEVV